jgi:hypothetical protein
VACVGCQPPKEPTVQHAVGWKAWYIGGRVYESASSSWGDLPDDGVLAVKVFFNDNTSRNCNGNDQYGLLILSPDSWTIIHNNNEDNLERYPNAIWKRGKWTSEEEMNAVVEAMNA